MAEKHQTAAQRHSGLHISVDACVGKVAVGGIAGADADGFHHNVDPGIAVGHRAAPGIERYICHLLAVFGRRTVGQWLRPLIAVVDIPFELDRKSVV